VIALIGNKRGQKCAPGSVCALPVLAALARELGDRGTQPGEQNAPLHTSTHPPPIFFEHPRARVLALTPSLFRTAQLASIMGYKKRRMGRHFWLSSAGGWPFFTTSIHDDYSSFSPSPPLLHSFACLFIPFSCIRTGFRDSSTFDPVPTREWVEKKSQRRSCWLETNPKVISMELTQLIEPMNVGRTSR